LEFWSDLTWLSRSAIAAAESKHRICQLLSGLCDTPKDTHTHLVSRILSRRARVSSSSGRRPGMWGWPWGSPSRRAGQRFCRSCSAAGQDVSRDHL